MKCGPDGCPIMAYTDLPSEKRKAQRKPLAEQLYRQGFTQEQIAAQFGVSQSTIRDDLDGLVPPTKPHRPKGGRPKGSTKPRSKPGEKADKFNAARAAVRDRIAAGKPLDARILEKEHGISRDTFERAALAEQARKDALEEIRVDPVTLSMTAQQKFDVAIQQYKRKLDIEFEQRVINEAQKRLEELAIPAFRERWESIRRMLDNRQNYMTRTLYKKILACLHPDSRRNMTEERLRECYHAFEKLEILLVPEKELSTKYITPKLPTSPAEWDAWKRAAQAERKAKRTANNNLQQR